MIESAEFITVDGFSVILADYSIPFENFTVTRDIRITETPRSQEHGLWPAPTFLGKMVLDFSGDILGDDSNDYNTQRLALTRAFYPMEIGQSRYIGTMYVQYSGMAERFTAKCGLESWPELPLEALSPSAGKYHVQLKSFDPRWYGEVSRQVISGTTTDASVGRTYPKTYPVTYGYTLFPSGDQIVTNAGNAETAPVITLFGPGTNPVVSIIIGATQYNFAVGMNLAATDEVVIDLANRTAVLNDTINIYALVSGDYWKLPPGDSTFRYSAALGTTTTNSRAVLSWKNAYVY